MNRKTHQRQKRKRAHGGRTQKTIVKMNPKKHPNSTQNMTKKTSYDQAQFFGVEQRRAAKQQRNKGKTKDIKIETKTEESSSERKNTNQTL